MSRKILAVVIVALTLLCMMPLTASAAEISYVRVLLSTNSASTISVQVNGAYGIPTRSDITLTEGDYTITNSGGTLVLSGPNVSGVNLGASFTFQQYASSSLSYLYLRNVSRSYLGDITFSASYNAVQCVNRVFIEDYVIGVIRGEMGESFPLDALRAQAIAARTYAYRALKTSGSYDIGDTSSDQVYRGYRSADTKCIQAVNDTQGLIVHYGSSVITTYYGASNGGQVELIGNKWSDRNSGPFSQMKDDPYDLRNPDSPVDSITISKSGSISNYSLDQILRQRMNGYYGSILGVQSIELSNPRMLTSGSETSRYFLNATFYLILPADGGNYGGTSSGWGSSGIVGGVVGGAVGGTTGGDTSGGTVNYSGETKIQAVTLNTQNDLIGIVSPSKKCSLFTVVDNGSAFRLEARRYGHGVGMSQRGAQQMANEGIGYAQIISFYYPNTALTKHEFVRTTPAYTGGNVPGEDQGQTTGSAIGTGVVTATTLNVRSQPSSTASKLGSLSRNATVSLLGESNGFYMINYNGANGYVSTQYISATLTGGTGNAGGDNTGGSQAAVQTGLIALTNASSNLNVRTGAGTSYGIAGQLKHGDSVNVTGTTGDWSAITSTKASGYVMTKYITITGSVGGSVGGSTGGIVGGTEGTPTPTPTPTPTANTGGIVGGVVGDTAVTPTPTPTPTANTGGVVGGVVGAPTATPTPTPTYNTNVTPTPVPTAAATAAAGTIRTNGGTVNMRAAPNTSGTIVARLGNNVSVTVLAQNCDWYKVTTQGITGYVSASYVNVAGTVPVESGTGGTGGTTGNTGSTSTGAAGAYYIKLTSVSSKMNLRSGPSTSTSSLATMGHGAVVSATGVVDGEWSQIVYNGKTGYVKTQYLSVDAPVGASYNNTMATTTGNVNLRSKASSASDSSVLAVVPKGTQVAVVKKGTEFTECVYNGKTGFISNQYLTF